MKIYQKIEFDAAHRLFGYSGNCSNLHGHTWKVELWLDGETDSCGMVLDYRAIKAYFKGKFDHTCLLNEKDPLKSIIQPCTGLPCNPTAENLAAIIKDDLKACKVRVWESRANYAEA